MLNMRRPSENQQAASVFERVQACHKTVITLSIPAPVLGTKTKTHQVIFEHWLPLFASKESEDNCDGEKDQL